MASISDQKHIDVYVRQDGLCALCGEPLIENPREMHHMLPKALGGDDSLDNLVLVCDREEHLWLHGGDFRNEIATTPETYPYFYGKSGKIEYEEPGDAESEAEEAEEPTQADNDSDVDEGYSDGGMG